MFIEDGSCSLTREYTVIDILGSLDNSIDTSDPSFIYVAAATDIPGLHEIDVKCALSNGIEATIRISLTLTHILDC